MDTNIQNDGFPEDYNFEKDLARRKKIKIRIAIAIAVLVFAASFLYLNKIYSPQDESIVTDGAQAWSTFEEDPVLSDDQQYVFGEKDPQLGGVILLTLAPKLFESPTNLPFMFDFQRERIVDTEMDLYSENSYGRTDYLQFSPNGKWASFYGATAKDAQVGQFDPLTSLQIYRSQLIYTSDESVLTSRFTEVKERAERVTNFAGNFKRVYGVNDAGGVLVSSAEPDVDNSIRPMESYTIRYVSPQGEVEVLTNGNYPRWVNDEVFLYLKNDSINLYSITNSADVSIFSLEGQYLYSNSMMNISKDGELIALSLPELRKLIILNFDKESEVFSLSREIDASGFWPTFSPDGNYITLQEVDWDQFAGLASTDANAWRAIVEPKPELSFWRIADLSKVDYTIDLSDYRQDYTFVTDWIK